MSQLTTESEPGRAYMTPRALILDLFGDYLRYAGGQARASELVTLLGAFGVEPAAVRMTLSRLRREQWFVTHREGREVTYVLSAQMLGVLRAGRARIFADYDEPWDMWWTTVIQQSAKSDRLTRDRVRQQLSWLGFGPLSASTWLTPRDRRGQAAELAAQFPEVRFAVMRSTTEDRGVDRDVAERCWDLGRMNRLYGTFLAENGHLADGGHLESAEALRARTRLIASYRHFPYLDPWLPKELRPDGWLGSDANLLFRSVHRDLGPAATAFVSEIIGRPIDTPETW